MEFVSFEEFDKNCSLFSAQKQLKILMQMFRVELINADFLDEEENLAI